MSCIQILYSNRHIYNHIFWYMNEWTSIPLHIDRTLREKATLKHNAYDEILPWMYLYMHSDNLDNGRISLIQISCCPTYAESSYSWKCVNIHYHDSTNYSNGDTHINNIFISMIFVTKYRFAYLQEHILTKLFLKM